MLLLSRSLPLFSRRLLFHDSFLRRPTYIISSTEPTSTIASSNTATATARSNSNPSTSWVSDFHDFKIIGISFGVLLLWAIVQVGLEWNKWLTAILLEREK